MNSQMAEVVVTFRDGRTHQLDNVFIRGNKVIFHHYRNSQGMLITTNRIRDPITIFFLDQIHDSA